MNVAGKRLLVVGAGRGQIGLYRAAREMGVHTIAGTLPDNDPPGIKLADEVCYMNIAKPDEVLEKARGLNLDGLATSCLDTGVPAIGKVCDALGFTGLTENAAVMCGDKLKMKRAFMAHGVSTARFVEIHSLQELETALETLKLPVIIKATDLQGSNGIYIAKTREAALEGYRGAMEKTRRDYCIVEQYIEGYEFGAQAFVYRGEVLFVMPHGDETYMSHTAVPVGHYVPFEGNEDVHRQAEVAVKGAIRALGLNNCAVNVDLIMKDGTVYVIELTGRVGANCLPELTQINFGIEYYKMIVAMALGENPLELWEQRRDTTWAGLAKMILETKKAGALKRIEYKGEIGGDVVEVTFFKHPGDAIRIFENSNDCVGQVIVQGRTMDDCKASLARVMDQIGMEVE